MKKQKEQHQLDEYENHCHLWNIVPGGKGAGIVLLRKVVDAIQHDNYSEPGNKIPVILITGATGKRFTARALVNSLAIEDIRICPALYFENGYYSHDFFQDSNVNTASMITNIEEIQCRAEPTLWKYLYNRKCSYYNGTKKEYDNTLYCHGLIVMTAHQKNLVSGSILKATDYVVELEPLNLDQLEAALHQRLVFCQIEYDGDEVLRAIVNQGVGKIEFAIPFLKHCLMVMKAEMADCLSMEVIKKASRISPMPVQKTVQKTDDIPF
jgi:hypothetical protein